MQAASKHNAKPRKRGVAAFAVAILLVVHSFGAAHFHRFPAGVDSSIFAAASADNGLCAICFFRVHSPTVLVATPSLNAPTLAELVIFSATQSEPCSFYRSHRFSRAPPAWV
jgi:hypothetical protein